MLCFQGDRGRSRRWWPGCYGQLGASFARVSREVVAEPGCYDALRASFVRAEFRKAGSKPLRLRHLARHIPSSHSVKGRSQSVLSRDQRPKTGQGRKQGARERPLPREFWPRNRRKPLAVNGLASNGALGNRALQRPFGCATHPQSRATEKKGARERPLPPGDSPHYRHKSVAGRSLREGGVSGNRALQLPFGCAKHPHFYVRRHRSSG